MIALHNQGRVQIQIGATAEDEKLMKDMVCRPYTVYNTIMEFMCVFPQQLQAHIRAAPHRKMD